MVTHARTPVVPARPKAGGARPDGDLIRLAAIDIGSNSIHMVFAQAETDGSITMLGRMKEMVGLGRASFPARRLTTRVMDLAAETMRRFVHSARRRQCEKIVAAATSAVRESENGGDFIERVRRELGLHVKVLSARDEARLIYLGVRHAVDLSAGPHLIMDVGGGSAEFVVADHAKAFVLESRKLGAARMTASFVHSDPVGAKDLKRLLAHYEAELAPLVEQVRPYRLVRAIGCSGTLENIAAMCGGARDANGDGLAGVIERRKLERVVGGLLESTSAERAHLRGLDSQRQDQIVAGALLVSEVFKRLDLKELHITRSALREGLLVDYLERHLPELVIRRQVPDPRRRSVMDLGRRCDWHPAHAEHVARLSLMLFDQLRPLHKLGKAQRELIEYGAMLHDIGWHIAGTRHHKHSMYLVLHGDLKGFTAEETAIIANIALPPQGAAATGPRGVRGLGAQRPAGGGRGGGAAADRGWPGPQPLPRDHEPAVRDQAGARGRADRGARGRGTGRVGRAAEDGVVHEGLRPDDQL